LSGDIIFFKNAKIVNVFTKEVLKGSFGIKNEKFIFIDYSPEQLTFSDFVSQYSDAQVFDLNEAYITPTFIDGHIHIESSHLVPSEFEKFALRSGVTKVVIDPHEIANVCGIEGVKFMLSDARVLEVYVMVPSCVPASPFETAGAEIGAKEIEELFSFGERILGLAEVMNFPGVVNEDPEVIAKIEVAKKAKKLIDGHAPLLRGKGLNKYIFEGIMSDHECVEGEEALEKLRLGMWVMVREGTASKNIYLLETLKRVGDLRKVMLVSDDVSPLELEEYMLKILRKAVKYVDPVTAIQMVTINPASYFGLETGIKPGAKADFLIFKNLDNFELKEVWIKGKPLSFWEKEFFKNSSKTSKIFTSSLKVSLKNIESFLIEGFDNGKKTGKVRVIKPIPDSLITEEVILEIKEARELLQKGELSRIYVIERHRGTERIGKGFILGVLKDGAVASSYAHDSHNIVAVGKNIEDIVIAVNELIKTGGGFVAVKEGRVLSKVPLEIAGIMTRDAEALKKNLKDFYQKVKELTPLKDLLLSMSFFSLSVIPELKLTDKGLVKNFEIVPLIEK